jgi:hypothetical protein
MPRRVLAQHAADARFVMPVWFAHKERVKIPLRARILFKKDVHALTMRAAPTLSFLAKVALVSKKVVFMLVTVVSTRLNVDTLPAGSRVPGDIVPEFLATRLW